MKRREEGYQRRRFCRTQILAIRRHVSSALNYLSNQLVGGEPRRHAIERRSSLTSALTK
jgi:hypothetical protein